MLCRATCAVQNVAININVVVVGGGVAEDTLRFRWRLLSLVVLCCVYRSLAGAVCHRMNENAGAESVVRHSTVVVVVVWLVTYCTHLQIEINRCLCTCVHVCRARWKPGVACAEPQQPCRAHTKSHRRIRYMYIFSHINTIYRSISSTLQLQLHRDPRKSFDATFRQAMMCVKKNGEASFL